MQNRKKSRIYCDYNATAPIRPEAREAMISALELPGNASSVHREGRRAKAMIETARRQLADLVGAQPESVVFVSGATEAINTICKPRNSHGRIAILASEHAAVLAGHRYDQENVEQINVNQSGQAQLSNDMGSDVDLVCIQMANSETGVLQPNNLNLNQNFNSQDLPMIFRDSVQVIGKTHFNINETDADLICVSSHKIGGPQGAAAIIAKNEDQLPTALIRGGGQEKGYRGGTENLAAIAGFGAAAAAVKQNLDQEISHTGKLKGQFESGLQEIMSRLSLDYKIHGIESARISNTTCFSIYGVEASIMLIAADLAGISLSSGSACSSGKVSKSHVLEAMGVSAKMNNCALRVSFGWNSADNDASDVLEFLNTQLPQILS